MKKTGKEIQNGKTIKRYRGGVHYPQLAVGALCPSSVAVVYGLRGAQSFSIGFYQLVSDDVDIKEMRGKITALNKRRPL